MLGKIAQNEDGHGNDSALSEFTGDFYYYYCYQILVIFVSNQTWIILNSTPKL